MITPRISLSRIFPDEHADDLSVPRQGKAKLEGYVQTLAAMASAIDKVSPRADRSKGRRPLHT